MRLPKHALARLAAFLVLPALAAATAAADAPQGSWLEWTMTPEAPRESGAPAEKK